MPDSVAQHTLAQHTVARTTPGPIPFDALTTPTAIGLRAHASDGANAGPRTLDDRKVMAIQVGRTRDGSIGPNQGALSTADGVLLGHGIQAAVDYRMPIVLTLSTSGVLVDEGIQAVVAWGMAARALAGASGVVPILMIADGPVVSGPALLLGMADVTVFTDEAYAFVSGPQMVESFTGVPISATELGGAGRHARSSGVASMVVPDVSSAWDSVASILAYLPDHVDVLPPVIETDDPVDRSTDDAADIVPAHATGSYDVRTLIADLADDGEVSELRAAWAPNLVTALISIGGQSIGVVANQTQSLAGSIDIPASHKGARFVSMCDAFNIPLLTLVDTSGFLPGKDLEWRGMIRHGAQLAFTYARATVPRVGLILRKSYGGAYIVMDSRYMGNDLMLAWPSAEVAVMGAKGAVEILHRGADSDERARLEAEYEATHLTPYPTAERGSISAVIEPTDTRRELAAAFQMLATKRERLRGRRHDNLPL